MKVAEYKSPAGGPSFFIPVFTADVKPVNQQEQEDYDNGLTEQEKELAWMINEHEKQLLDIENNFPQTYK